MVECLGVSEDSGQGVVVAGGDRVELVVVASSTADRLSQEASGDGFELFVDDVHPEFILVLVFEVVVSQGQEGGGDDLALLLFERFGHQQVAGELFVDELVEGSIRVERLDHVIPVPPGLGKQEAA